MNSLFGNSTEKVISVTELAQRVLGEDVVNDILEFDPKLELEAELEVKAGNVVLDTRWPILDWTIEFGRFKTRFIVIGFSSVFKVGSLALSFPLIVAIDIWIIQYVIRNLQLLDQIKQYIF